jgi:hypothetical protein
MILTNSVTFLFAASILYLKITIERQRKLSFSASQ